MIFFISGTMYAQCNKVEIKTDKFSTNLYSKNGYIQNEKGENLVQISEKSIIDIAENVTFNINQNAILKPNCMGENCVDLYFKTPFIYFGESNKKFAKIDASGLFSLVYSKDETPIFQIECKNADYSFHEIMGYFIAYKILMKDIDIYELNGVK